MAKKIVRGITDIKTINNQDFDTNNVNDLLSDGEHSYIHRKKKDKSEEYHCLTDNVKTVETTDASLLKVTNYNKTANKVTLSPQHDDTKQDKLTAGYGVSIENNVINAPLFTRLEIGYDLNNLNYGFVRGDQLVNAPGDSWFYIMGVTEANYGMQIAWKLKETPDETPSTYRRDKVNNVWSEWVTI